jgi:hypothetical protein
MAMTVRFTPEQDSKLQQIAHDNGISKQQALVLILDQHDERQKRKQQMDQVLQLVLSRDAELMERLADA